MSATYGQDERDNPFDASYEEYVRTVEEREAASEGNSFVPTRGDEGTDDPDDPEVTQASAGTQSGKGVEASWSDLAETTEGDPFAAPEDGSADSASEGGRQG